MPDLGRAGRLGPAQEETIGVDRRGRPATADMPVLVLTGKELTEEESSFLHTQTMVTFRKSQDWKDQLLNEIARVIENKAEAVP